MLFDLHEKNMVNYKFSPHLTSLKAISNIKWKICRLIHFFMKSIQIVYKLGLIF
jgi:hypothetical protein